MEVQPDGKVVVAVKALLGSTFGFAVARFDAGGGRELDFGSGGLATALFGTQHIVCEQLISKLVIQSQH